MKRPVLLTLSALLPLVLVGCSQNGAALAASGPASASASAEVEDWLAAAADIVRFSDDPDEVWECEYVDVLAIPSGWDGELGALTHAEQAAVEEMKLAAARIGANFVLMISEDPPRAEGYLCSE